MAAGKVVIASSVGGNREQIVDGVSGYLVPPADSEALAKKLYDILSSPEKRNQMGKAAFLRTQERFSVDRMVDDHERLYRKLLNRSDL
jgi:glycosyltransferase involved in cell wall biosynthesis